MCRQNEEGINIIIPILLPDQGVATPKAIDLIPEYRRRPKPQQSSKRKRGDSGEQFKIPLFTVDTANTTALGATTAQAQQQRVDKKSVICIDPSRVSFILVQVKNYESGTGDKRKNLARDCLLPSECVVGVKDDDVPYVGIWMQTASIQGQVAGVKGIPLVECDTPSTERVENMLGLFTDQVGTRTFPFLNKLPSMRQASPGTHQWVLHSPRALR